MLYFSNTISKLFYIYIFLNIRAVLTRLIIDSCVNFSDGDYLLVIYSSICFLFIASDRAERFLWSYFWSPSPCFALVNGGHVSVAALKDSNTRLFKLNNNLSLQSVRFYSISAINSLALLHPCQSYTGPKLITCSNLLNLKEREKFFSAIKGKGPCIYIFMLKYNEKLFYIGRTLDLRSRFNDHKKDHKRLDKFHVLVRRVGWDKFSLSVIEFCEKKDIMERENYYITHYFPVLNTQKKVSLSKRIGSGCQVWVYNTETFNLINNIPFPSIKSAADYLSISTSRLAKHLDTSSCINISGKMWVYLFSSEISEGKLAYLKNNVKKAYNSVVSIWVYKINRGCAEVVLNLLGSKRPFKTILQAARYINISPHTISKYIDTNLLYKEFYFFSKPESLDRVQNIFNRAAVNAKGIWVYKELKGEIILLHSQPFTSNYKAGRALKIGELSVKKYTDTYRPFKGLYFLSKQEINLDLLKNKISEASNVREGIWVYKKLNSQYSLLDNNQPFKSKWLACKALNIGHKNIEKSLDTHSPYKEFYFFSRKI